MMQDSAKKRNWIIISALLATLVLYLFEQVLLVDFFIKTAVKIVIFCGIPFYYLRPLSKAKIKETFALKRDGNLKWGILLGFGSFTVVILAYFIFRGMIDFPSIVAEIQEKSKVTPANFFFVALYVTFGNSFLEEFFFRGHIFLKLDQLGYTRLAYVFSSALFALYHITIFQTWFNPLFMTLALIALLVIGFVFDYVDRLSGNLLNSWIIHIFADLAIVLIGFSLFGFF